MKTATLFLAIGVAMLAGVYAGGVIRPRLAAVEDAAAPSPPDPPSAAGADYGRAAWASYADGADEAIGANWAPADYARMAALADRRAKAEVAPPPTPAPPVARPTRHEPLPAFPAPPAEILAGLRSYAPPVSLDTAPPEPPPA